MQISATWADVMNFTNVRIILLKFYLPNFVVNVEIVLVHFNIIVCLFRKRSFLTLSYIQRLESTKTDKLLMRRQAQSRILIL
jgi:hypothetical protein